MSDDTINVDWSTIKPVEFTWDKSNTITGITAQEISPVQIDSTAYYVSVGAGIGIGNGSNSSYTISTPYEDMEQRLQKLEKIVLEEAELRANHPAVKQAYDEYRLLLVLAK